VAPRIGLDIPTSKLNPFLVAAVEFDVFLPVLDNRLVLALDFSFTYPREDGSGNDPRIGGSYDWETKVLELKWALDVIWRFFDDSHTLIPYAGLGPVIQYLSTKQTTSIPGSGENTERNAEFGFEILGGLDWQLGPGYLFGDLRFVFTKLDHRFTGDINAGNVTICAGYRFVFSL
jgi:opacity protein-like surface antigen